MTFSLVARCEETGMFGIAISSSSPAVAARCSYARAGVGAVASQNITDPTLGKRGLDLTGHCSRPLDDGVMNVADLVLTMTGGHRDAILAAWPEMHDRIHNR